MNDRLSNGNKFDFKKHDNYKLYLVFNRHAD